MRPGKTLVLLWKEASEARFALYAAAVAFVVVPLFAVVATAGSGDHPRVAAMLLGGLFALVVGAGCTARDARDAPGEFRRSLPVGIAHWLAVKFAVNLAIVLLIHAAAMLAQAALHRYLLGIPAEALPALSALYYHGLSLTLIFGVAFLLGCATGRPAQASALALAALLLIYFVPLLFPALRRLSVHHLIEEATRAARADASHAVPSDATGRWRLIVAGSLPFALLAVGGAAVAWGAAVAAVRRGWRLRPDLKAMTWTLACVALLLFTLGAVRLGSNLKAERIVQFNDPGSEARRYVAGVMTDGWRGAAQLYDLRPSSPHTPPWRWLEDGTAVPPQGRVAYGLFDLLKPDPFIERIAGPPQPSRPPRWAWTAARPDRVFMLPPVSAGSDSPSSPSDAGHMPETAMADGSYLMAIGTSDAVRMPLPSQDKAYDTLFAASGRLFVYSLWSSPRLPALAIGVSDDSEPRVSDAEPIRSQGSAFHGWAPLDPNAVAGGRLAIALPALPGLNPRERLDALTRFGMAVEGGTLATVDEGGVVYAWRLESLDETSAVWSLAGKCEPSPLERALRGLRRGDSPPLTLLHRGVFYVTDALPRPGVTAYDLTDPARPRRAGHYAAPDEAISALAPLPGGRVLVTGYRMHVVNPPN